MDGIATAVVGFIFVCIIYPHLIKNRTHYYMALAAIVLVLVMRSVATVFAIGGFIRFVEAFSYLLEAAAVLLLVMAAGGLTARELAGDMARAYEVMRRGETEKTVIIPLPGQAGRGGKARDAGDEEDETPSRFIIDDPPPPPASKPKGDGGGPIPLE